MSKKMEKLLSLLSDNVWHSIDEMGKLVEIPQDKLQQLVKLLAETDLIQHNPATNQIKLNQNWRTLVASQRVTSSETQAQSETTAVATLIIPPQKTLLIQCTRITNLTDNSLEIEMRINKKISEIAISKIK